MWWLNSPWAPGHFCGVSIVIVVVVVIGGSKGGCQGHVPPWGSKFFHFHAVFGKKLKNNSTFGSWRPPGENPGSATLLFGSCAGTRQIRDQSRALEDRNDSNNSLEVHTPNSFIHLLYNSPYMDIVNMHNVVVTPSDSVLWEKTMEASYVVGSFPCQLSQVSLTDIPVWDEVWEQATFRHLCTLW